MVLWCTENADRNKPTSEYIFSKFYVGYTDI